uniref:Uncharacterized protein n=1 Tax=Glossina austeni TaxID=7395 RepID=A0A1A9UEM4_GLOAU
MNCTFLLIDADPLEFEIAMPLINKKLRVPHVFINGYLPVKYDDAKVGGLSDQLVSKVIKNRLATLNMSRIGFDEKTTAIVPSSFLCPVLVAARKPNGLTTTLDCMEA